MNDNKNLLTHYSLLIKHYFQKKKIYFLKFLEMFVKLNFFFLSKLIKKQNKLLLFLKF